MAGLFLLNSSLWVRQTTAGLVPLVQLKMLVSRYMWEQVLHYTDVWGLLEILDPGVAAGGCAGSRRLCRMQEAGQGAGLAGGLSRHFTDLRQVCGRLAETR